jgi:uroporphyrinogen decarboxylase
MNPSQRPDGIHAILPREHMTAEARAWRDIYARVPGARIPRKEFWLMGVTLERWKREEGLPQEYDGNRQWSLEPLGWHPIQGLGWCEAAFHPAFPTAVLEDRGDHEVVRDWAGRHVLVFKGRREGFMPEYLDHPVKDRATWERDVRWRLDPAAPGRFDALPERIAKATAAAARGEIVCQQLVGGYMYLRSLIGPERLLYAVVEEPELIQDCMRTWYELADAVIAQHQQHVTLDEIFFAEDICYNKGSLISPRMMREYLFPWYRKLIERVRARQIDRNRHLFVQVDTDGLCVPVIDLYREGIGMDVMSPFEVASGCDVVEIGQRWPDLVMLGGIDKRVLSQGERAIDAMLERIIPAMRARGGYIATIDHGVPPETPMAGYLHYRKRMVELGG